MKKNHYPQAQNRSIRRVKQQTCINPKGFPRGNFSKDDLERLYGCSVCGKIGCCDDDHRFHGVLIGMGF